MSKLSFDRETLLTRLKLLASILPKKPVLSAHEQFLFNVKSGVASITSTDGQKQITATCETAKFEDDIKFTIPGRLLFSTLTLLLDSEVKFTVKDGTVTLKCGKSTYKMASENGAYYPFIQDIKSDFEASFNGAVINEALDTAKKYTDPESSVVAYQGVNLSFVDGKMNICGIDNGHSMCKVVTTPRSVNKWEDILIPSSAVKAIVSCVSDSDIVDISHDKTKLEVKTPNISIIALALDIKYPNVEALYQKNTKQNFVKYNTVQFLNAIERMKPYAKEEFPCMTIDMQTSQTVLSVDNVDYNRDGTEEIESIANVECKIGIGIDRMINALKSFTNDEFMLYFINEKVPFFIEPVNIVKDNDKFILLAPVKL